MIFFLWVLLGTSNWCQVTQPQSVPWKGVKTDLPRVRDAYSRLHPAKRRPGISPLALPQKGTPFPLRLWSAGQAD